MSQSQLNTKHEGQTQLLSTRSILSAIGCRLFSGMTQEPKKPPVIDFSDVPVVGNEAAVTTPPSDVKPKAGGEKEKQTTVDEGKREGGETETAVNRGKSKEDNLKVRMVETKAEKVKSELPKEVKYKEEKVKEVRVKEVRMRDKLFKEDVVKEEKAKDHDKVKLDKPKDRPKLEKSCERLKDIRSREKVKDNKSKETLVLEKSTDKLLGRKSLEGVPDVGTKAKPKVEDLEKVDVGKEDSSKGDDVSKDDGLKPNKSYVVTPAPKDVQEENWKKTNRDFLKLKTKYNNGIGNIMRTWMSLVYCVLTLRSNLIQFLRKSLKEEMGVDDDRLTKQLEEENVVIFRMVKKAETYSQIRSLYLWIKLEKLILSRIIIKNALDVLQFKNYNKDWKAADLKLTQLQHEVDNMKSIQASICKNEPADELVKLEAINTNKERLLKQVIQQVTDQKKQEFRTRGKLLVTMKNFKDMAKRRKQLLSMQRALTHMKSNQKAATARYMSKIQMIKNEIQEHDRQIQLEKLELQKLKGSWDGNACPAN